MKRLNLIKRLASTNWGSDKNTLRGLYLGYARAVFDYNLVLQNLCSKATKKSLDVVQNHALRFISGGMRSSPTAACELNTNIEPLENRRKRAAIELYERSKKLEAIHSNRILVDKWTPNQQLKSSNSILDEACKFKETQFLPENREPLERVSPTLPPHLLLKKNRYGQNTFGRLQQTILPHSTQSVCLRDHWLISKHMDPFLHRRICLQSHHQCWICSSYIHAKWRQVFNSCGFLQQQGHSISILLFMHRRRLPGNLSASFKSCLWYKFPV